MKLNATLKSRIEKRKGNSKGEKREPEVFKAIWKQLKSCIKLLLRKEFMFIYLISICSMY